MTNRKPFGLRRLIRGIRYRANHLYQHVMPLSQADYTSAGAVPQLQRFCFDAPSDGQNMYSAVQVGPATLASQIVGEAPLRGVLSVLKQLEPDDYIRYTTAYYQEGLRRFGANWRYADIVTVLYGLSGAMQPEAYLEIGVRRGRSMAMVASQSPQCRIIGFDLWMQDYSGMSNPGPEFVRAEMSRIGHRGPLDLVSGNSHQVVKRHFQDHADAFFDLITVDGDHSRLGAAEDLADVMPRLKVGGAIVFDDIAHPRHPELREVWRGVVASDRRFASWEFDELGYGVAVGIRKW